MSPSSMGTSDQTSITSCPSSTPLLSGPEVHPAAFVEILESLIIVICIFLIKNNSEKNINEITYWYSYFTFPFFQIDSSILKHLSDVTKKRCFWCLLLCILKLIKSWHSIFSFKQLSLTLLLREPEGYKRMFWGLNRFF